MSSLMDIEEISDKKISVNYLNKNELINDEILNQKIEAYQKQADALTAYLEFQNKQVGIIAQYIEKGGVISPKLSESVDQFQKNGLIALRKYILTQKRKIRELSIIE